AVIRSELSCDGGTFICREDKALNVSAATIEGTVFMRNGFRAEGEVSLTSAKINGYFFYTDVASPKTSVLDLRSVKVGTLWDDSDSWPEKGKLLLHGFVYDRIDSHASMNVQDRISWLQLQGGARFQPQPYEQLAAVFRNEGRESEARQILIAKNRDRARLTQMPMLQRCWHLLLGIVIGYGYRPWQALWFVLAFVLVGSILFGAGWGAGIITPTNVKAYDSDEDSEQREISSDYPRFNALVYSIDTFVPLIDLQQAKYWLPNANRESLGFRTGMLVRFYLWLHIAAGWTLTTLLAVGLSGLVRR
ncbi:MAG: hypothetical protein QGG71_27055, partial [Pirellulaceae bacterium]|nr:hypothetical protein [Pirellulaceae bacterium]